MLMLQLANAPFLLLQTGRVLVLRNVSSSDSGIYVCFATVPLTTTVKTTPIPTLPSTTMTKAATTSSQQQQPIEEDAQQQHEQKLQEERELEQKQVNEEKQKYEAIQRIRLTVRTTPGPVTQLYFKASTILGFLIWRFNKTLSGGYPVRSFTAEYRNVSYHVQPTNASYEHEWTRMDPINIAPNVRQMEVYRLAPNTTYEFRIWANNEMGSGEVVTTNVTTLPETKEEELQDGWDSIELIPNIILNPGFSESDGAKSVPPFKRTVIFGHNGQEYDDDEDDEEEQEPTMERFKRKVSVFFTGPTIKRI
ncbi:hypothetical protein ACLKA7_011626 [Drosophila subpalustris]